MAKLVTSYINFTIARYIITPVYIFKKKYSEEDYKCLVHHYTTSYVLKQKPISSDNYIPDVNKLLFPKPKNMDISAICCNSYMLAMKLFENAHPFGFLRWWKQYINNLSDLKYINSNILNNLYKNQHPQVRKILRKAMRLGFIETIKLKIPKKSNFIKVNGIIINICGEKNSNGVFAEKTDKHYSNCYKPCLKKSAKYYKMFDNMVYTCEFKKKSKCIIL